jgi:hypothetical protein
MTTGQLIYPKADTKTQWYYGGRFAGQGITMGMDKGVKWLQHTTESAGGWPTYSDGAICPTLTYEPWAHQWRQHMPVNHSARALKGDGDAYTNRQNVVQTEISCYCDEALARQQGRMDRFVENIDAQAIDDLGDFAVWMHAEWGMVLDWYPDALNWPAYNGTNRIARLTVAQFDAFSGILGHMAAPGEDHLDPSSLDNVAIKARVEAVLGQGQGDSGPFPLLRDIQIDIGWANNRLRAQQAALADFAKGHPAMKQVAVTIADLETAIPVVHTAHDDLTPLTGV